MKTTLSILSPDGGKRRKDTRDENGCIARFHEVAKPATDDLRHSSGFEWTNWPTPKQPG